MPRPYDKDVVLDDKGTLWVATDDVKKVNRVIVVDDISHWCLTFYTYPTEEPVKHGHWEEYLAEGLRWKCSVCGSRFETPYHYCPHCGKEMKEVENAEIH